MSTTESVVFDIILEVTYSSETCFGNCTVNLKLRGKMAKRSKALRSGRSPFSVVVGSNPTLANDSVLSRRV
ncbi:hypothetical protein M514_10181 [Trichuris suis]|uniref:Uncharacterized protein n=1 Tax=Trichuris suis TaxID=68888 RepID=A0A085LVE4_9BILA|nr:hypothetical protein M513_10181 [Trichuris suis]KFD68465.1 hypothetical protein M514_10181 [Trichuris suis]